MDLCREGMCVVCTLHPSRRQRKSQEKGREIMYDRIELWPSRASASGPSSGRLL